MPTRLSDSIAITDQFVTRHVGPNATEIQEMLSSLGFSNLDELVKATVPDSIRVKRDLDLPEALSEFETLKELKAIASQNKPFRSFIGMGYHGTITPPVIQRNILENPGWYTQYTPYQAEIAQGRLEALFNFQTMISELTGLEIANSSLLDEGTAAAEAMALASRGNRKNKSVRFLVSHHCHPQTIDVLQTRAEPLGMQVVVADVESTDISDDFVGVLLQYPHSDGSIQDYKALAAEARKHNVTVVFAADLLALTLLEAPGELGADIVVGSSQRFGVPLGFGGPHAGYMSCTDAFKRQIPGRIVGQSVDAQGNPALRLALQTREQHIRREKATSNICTAQVLLAIIAGMYASYHGPEGLKAIALRVHKMTQAVAAAATKLGLELASDTFFDTIRIRTNGKTDAIREAATALAINFRYFENGDIGISLDEATTKDELASIFAALNQGSQPDFALDDLEVGATAIPAGLGRTTPYLTQECFNAYHSETELLRYIFRLQGRDLSLTTSMIPLGSCTMKLNATTEMLPVTWPEFGGVHPFAPSEQTAGYREMFRQLEDWLSEITGMKATSLQPNAGSQGEYAGMLVIQAFHKANGEGHRDICLIPTSAHGTNPASAIMAGMKVVAIATDDAGNIDIDDLRNKAAEHADNLSAIMVTYPSTHGVFETEIRTICDIVHENGGQVYLDGANMNAQVGICRPGDYGADVCHLNLHKTFCIPHGGGGPGMGPICVQAHLAPFLPGHPVITTGGEQAIGAVSAAPWGSPSILPISWAYIRMLGASGLEHATKVAILNANYMAKRLEDYYPVLYRGVEGQCAHEFILDFRHFKDSAGVQVVDVAKRLMDFGFHAPTMSWPVAGTMMIEPTESESKAELDRLCDALITIHGEITAIETGEWSQEDNPLVNAPHTVDTIIGEWQHEYSRETAAFPASWTKVNKFWPAVGRVNDAHGDKNLVCTCPPMSEYVDAAE